MLLPFSCHCYGVITCSLFYNYWQNLTVQNYYFSECPRGQKEP